MSKKKTLLEEGTMRRFMKLANMEAIGDSFINEMYGAKMKDEDEHLDEGDRKDDDAAADAEDTKMRTNKEPKKDDLDEGSHDMKSDDPMMDDAMQDDPMMDDAMMDDAMQDDEEMMDVEDKEEEMDMDAGDMGELTLTDEEAEVFLKVADKVRAAMEMDAPEEMPAPDMGDMDEPMDEPMDDMEMDAEEETEEEPMMDDMVNEVARRVARRLNGLKKSK